MYRLIKTRRFRRILFLVDRTALGEQAADNLKDVRLEHQQTFPDIYDIKELGDGSLLVSDDYAGMVYRISYGG